MAEPQTVNLGLIVAGTGNLVDTWGAVALNPDFVALDGSIAGVQTVGVTNVPVTLTSPSGFTATPGPGPTQSQNWVLRFTGVMSGNVRVTLPLPGSYLIDNRTTGAFVLSFQGITATEVVAIAQGEIVEIYNDGANVRFVNLGRVGELEHWAGITAIPAWVNACTVKPYLLADASIYNFSDFPWLGAKYLGQFGGNGSTTFGVPDLQGRVPLAYDGTGTRITTAGCGLNGQTIGAFIDTQSVTLNTTQIPAHNHTGTTGNDSPDHTHAYTAPSPGAGTGTTPNYFNSSQTAANTGGASTRHTHPFTSNNTGGGLSHSNVQPSQVTGVWVCKT